MSVRIERRVDIEKIERLPVLEIIFNFFEVMRPVNVLREDPIDYGFRDGQVNIGLKSLGGFVETQQ